MIGKREKKKAVKAAITNEQGKLLVLIKSTHEIGLYKTAVDLPGGRVEAGEAKKKALKRECLEELGIKRITINQIVDNWHVELPDGDKLMGTTFWVIPEQYDFILSHEHLDYKWVDEDEIRALNCPFESSLLKVYHLIKKLKNYGRVD